MLCTTPRTIWFPGGSKEVPCGHRSCIACRQSKQQDWLSRHLLEGSAHEYSSFVTLTESDEHQLHTPDGATVCPKRTRDFLKRLRYYMGGTALRYQLISEYSPGIHRPHYHAVVHGLSADRHLKKLEKAWPFGFIDAQHLDVGAIIYVTAHHIHAGLPRGLHKEDLGARKAPFRRQSPLGKSFVPNLAKAMNPGNRKGDAVWFDSQEFIQDDISPERADVLPAFRQNGHVRAIPAYIKTKVREELGLPELLRDGRLRRLQAEPTEDDYVNSERKQDKIRKNLRARGKG